MKVTIIDKESNKAVAEYPIHISGQNNVPPEDEYFNSAWDNVIEDELVNSDEREKHTFILEE